MTIELPITPPLEGGAHVYVHGPVYVGRAWVIAIAIVDGRQQAQLRYWDGPENRSRILTLRHEGGIEWRDTIDRPYTVEPCR